MIFGVSVPQSVCPSISGWTVGLLALAGGCELCCCECLCTCFCWSICVEFFWGDSWFGIAELHGSSVNLAHFCIIGKYTVHKIYHSCVFESQSAALRTLTLSCSHQHRPSPELSHLPKQKHCPHETRTPSAPSLGATLLAHELDSSRRLILVAPYDICLELMINVKRLGIQGCVPLARYLRPRYQQARSVPHGSAFGPRVCTPDVLHSRHLGTRVGHKCLGPGAPRHCPFPWPAPHWHWGPPPKLRRSS